METLKLFQLFSSLVIVKTKRNLLFCFNTGSHLIYYSECTFIIDNWCIINSGYWTEWSTIWAEIICVISKLNERAGRVRFEIISMISDQNCTRRSSITTLYIHFIDAVLNWFEIKFIHFFWGKKYEFGNKSSKICHMILFVSHFTAIWLVTLNKPWNLSGCFVFSIVSSFAGKKMRSKAKNGANMNNLWINRTT